jgi:hypothetical protein
MLSLEERKRTAFHESGIRHDTAPPRATVVGRCQAADAAAG